MLIPSVMPDRPEAATSEGFNMLRRMTEGKRRYLLEVQIQVPATERDKFSREALELLETFRKVGLGPKVSAWRTNTGPIFVVNYWDMGSDANVLFEAELALPDIPQFNAFNAIVRNEIKNIVVPITGSEHVPRPGAPNVKLPSEGYRYLRVDSVVPAVDLPEFVARVEGYMGFFTRAAGWFFGDTYLGITGTEGAVSQLWIIPASECPKVPARLKKAPWLQTNIVKEAPAFQILRATHSDPNIEPSNDLT